MVNWPKISAQVGSHVSTHCLRGTVQVVTDQHILLTVKGLREKPISVWVARNQLRGMYK